MNRTTCTVALTLAAAVIGLSTLSLRAQPEPYKPVSTVAPYELILPPGTYQSLVVSFEGGSAKTVKATLEAPSGHLVLIVPAGESLIVPLHSSGWTISQEVKVKLTQPVGQVFISAITAAGPIKLEPAKK